MTGPTYTNRPAQPTDTRQIALLAAIVLTGVSTLITIMWASIAQDAANTIYVLLAGAFALALQLYYVFRIMKRWHSMTSGQAVLAFTVLTLALPIMMVFSFLAMFVVFVWFIAIMFRGGSRNPQSFTDGFRVGYGNGSPSSFAQRTQPSIWAPDLGTWWGDVPIQRGVDGRPIFVGADQVRYGYDGRITHVGNREVLYGAEGRPSWIGNDQVLFGADPQCPTWIGGLQVRR